MAVSAARRHEALRAVPNLPDRQILLDLFERMVLLRRFESVAQIACRKGETPGFLHLYIGEEATGAGVCAHLRPTDWVTSTHRGHGHALAKGADPGRVMAELFGKVGGICGGRGGTMHLYDRSVGLFGTNGIVAAGIGHAVGIGMSARLQGRDDIGVAFFGDGAANHGAFHEALNFAAVQRAPAVFVCENNLYATATPLKSITLNPEIATKAASYGMPGVAVDGNDVFAVWLAMKEATEYGNGQSAKENNEALDEMRKSGKTELITLTKEQDEAMRKAMLPVYKEVGSRVGKDLINEFLKEEGRPPID